jgi:hypothetical protein
MIEMEVLEEIAAVMRKGDIHKVSCVREMGVRERPGWASRQGWVSEFAEIGLWVERWASAGAAVWLRFGELL